MGLWNLTDPDYPDYPNYPFRFTRDWSDFHASVPYIIYPQPRSDQSSSEWWICQHHGLIEQVLHRYFDWVCRSFALPEANTIPDIFGFNDNFPLNNNFQLNDKAKLNCHKCNKPRGQAGNGRDNNSIEHMICTTNRGFKENCGYINGVNWDVCGNEGCKAKLPNHPDTDAHEKTWKFDHLELMSHRVWEDYWVCPCCSMTNRQDWDVCRLVGCNKPRDVHALWIVGGKIRQV